MDLFSASQQILGLNARNLLYLRRYTPGPILHVLDNKLKTKRALRAYNIPVPQTYAVIHTAAELAQFPWASLPKSFALKPNRGLGGAGIVVAYGEHKKSAPSQEGQFFPPHARERVWIGSQKTRIAQEQLVAHILNILDGRFSLTRRPDAAYFEERIKLLKDFRVICPQGIPDIRVIVFNRVPVMAQLRIPTKESGGRANLHLGAVGVGIDMGSGTTTYAIHHDAQVHTHPDNPRVSLRGIGMPAWEDILELAVQAQDAVGAKFLGVDISIDKERGPVVLELNARPGLAIQLANRAPLRARLDRVEGLDVASCEQGVQLGQNLFAQKTDARPKRKILGVREPVILLGSGGKEEHVVARVDTGAYRTAIDAGLAERLGFKNIITYKGLRSALGAERRPIVEVSFRLGGKTIHTEASLSDRSALKTDMIIGRRDLAGFLVDPAKNEREVAGF